ncbi:MAG: TRAP transporter small permease subunit [Gammaproteobacteria bacterium]|nr:TRAP transporter small permease subunit [Gammaproteobacteria bacterium]NIM74355.1 TRAP transporter small permease subunit [Gammaproteobacteria bacterium]NIO26127.1 TRAP transporter small permease subunit [Gammaproteobacteria bacterium]NIO66740.1 TRAP transporter small permease subunit [Gammaproteobacteria bacterium]NIP44997.1 TRAP transporter small permease [Gammaproteobacteria bacterium]
MEAQPGGAQIPMTSALRAADRWLSRVEDFFDLVAAFFIVFLMLFAVTQVISRKLFNYPLWGYVDIVEIIMVTFAFLGIAYCQRLGGHVRMELLVRRLHGRALWIFEVVGIVIAIGIISVLLYYGFTHFLRAFQLGDSTIDREIILWPSKLVVPVAFAVLSARLLIQFLAYTRLALHPDAEPVAVPVIEKFEEMAQHEIEGAMGSTGENERNQEASR